MDATAYSALPWGALKHTQGGIPWPAIRQFSESLSADSTLLEPLLEMLDEALEDPYVRGSFECLYIPAIIALAAPNLGEQARKEAVEFLAEAVVDTGEDEDGVLEETLLAACGALGAEAVLPVVMELISEDLPSWSISFGLWRLTQLVRDTENVFLRTRVADFCTNALRLVAGGQIDMDCVAMAAMTLGRMGHTEARPLLSRLVEQTGSVIIRDALDFMDGKWPYDYPAAWERPVEQWLEEHWEAVKDWYAEPDEGPLDEPCDYEDYEDYEGELEAGERRANELSMRFAESPAVAALPEPMREGAAFISGCLLHYAWDYVGKSPEELDEQTLREVLLELLPRKVLADENVFECVAPVSQVFLGWLEAEGILPGGARLGQTIAGWGKQIVSNAADPSCWGMAKGMGMLAESQGVDMSDIEAFKRFVLDYNRRVSVVSRHESEADDRDAYDDYAPVAAPIVNETAKVGRNEPCPCGSGKKYKKCCGR